MAVSSRSIERRLRATNCCFGRRDNDLYICSKVRRQKIKGWRAIIGVIGSQFVDGTTDLVQNIWQNSRITNVIRSQIGANDLTADKIETAMKFAPSFACELDFVLFFQPFAGTESVSSRAVEHKVNRFAACGLTPC